MGGMGSRNFENEAVERNGEVGKVGEGVGDDVFGRDGGLFGGVEEW